MARWRPSRRARWGALLAAVLALHLLGVSWLQERLVGWGAAEAPMPARMEVAFVQTLAPAAPPAAAPVAAKPARPKARPAGQRVVSPALAAASAPVPDPEPAPAVEGPAVAVATPPTPEPAASAAAVAEPAAVAAAPAASAPAAPAFEWPPSTRLTYTLAGNYRGEVNGNARVQWVRVGERYQVHLDVNIGPSFAPLITRRMTSDGVWNATLVAFQTPRRVTVQFTPGQVTLANGSLRDAPAGVQDAASQFVHLTWLFTTQPARLRVGEVIELPLALPRRVDRWFYDVVGRETLRTPVGELDAFHLKPRRAGERPRGELSAEVWFAPSLQYLPVRIRIQQDAETYVDLVMDAAPLQAAPDGPPR
jgi:Protein of unknown function (DUF3108)